MSVAAQSDDLFVLRCPSKAQFSATLGITRDRLFLRPIVTPKIAYVAPRITIAAIYRRTPVTAKSLPRFRDNFAPIYIGAKNDSRGINLLWFFSFYPKTWGIKLSKNLA